jgi:hypothetical protein
VESEETLRLMRLIDEQFLETPWYGSRQMARYLRRNGWCVGRHRIRRLMTKMGLAPIYQHPKTSEPQRGHFRRLSSLANGKSRPRVHTSVCKSSSAPWTHSLMRFMASRGPHALRTVTRNPRS